VKDGGKTGLSSDMNSSQPLLLKERNQNAFHLLGKIKVDQHDFYLSNFKLRIQCHKIGQLFVTGFAPGSPKADDISGVVVHAVHWLQTSVEQREGSGFP